MQKLIEWLGGQGCKGTLEKSLVDGRDLSAIARRVIELRLDGAHASANKCKTMLAWRNADGRVRGALKYHGASPGRWSSPMSYVAWQSSMEVFHEGFASLKFFDPACGCGIFLIIAYRELRALEIELLKEIYPQGQRVLDVASFSKINVNQFYGIELRCG